MALVHKFIISARSDYTTNKDAGVCVPISRYSLGHSGHWGSIYSAEIAFLHKNMNTQFGAKLIQCITYVSKLTHI